VIVRGDARERVLHAGVILLATGSRPFHPPDVPFDDPDVHDSQSFLSIERIPERLLVVGAGPVGAEYASIFTGLGVEVTVVDRAPRMLPILDSELAGALAAVMERAGARFLLGAEVQSIGRDADGLAVVVDGETIRPELVLHAIGRAGNIEGLGLEEVGVEADQFGRIQIDDHYQTNVPGIYAAGDVIGPPGLASVAMEQARVAMCRAFDIPFKEHVDPMIPTGIYTLPEMSMVGVTEEAMRTAGEDVETGRARFDANARAQIAGLTEGMVKLVFRASDKQLLGAHILGEEATELIHVAQGVLHNGGTIDEFIDTTFNFPTRTDAYKYAAYDGLQRLQARARDAR
jgi:NAD(P) transhydrogenase